MKKYLIDAILSVYPSDTQAQKIIELYTKLEISPRQLHRYRNALIGDSLDFKSYQLTIIADILNVPAEDLINQTADAQS